jgi:glycolate oxidase
MDASNLRANPMSAAPSSRDAVWRSPAERTGSLLLENAGVPLPRPGDLVLGIREIARAIDVVIELVAYAGDGNARPLMVFDPLDDVERATANAAFDQITQRATGLGGVIPGEHGLGRMRRLWLPRNLGPDGRSTAPSQPRWIQGLA